MKLKDGQVKYTFEPAPLEDIILIHSKVPNLQMLVDFFHAYRKTLKTVFLRDVRIEKKNDWAQVLRTISKAAPFSKLRELVLYPYRATVWDVNDEDVLNYVKRKSGGNPFRKVKVLTDSESESGTDTDDSD